jgi:hypothetical protein
MLMSYGKRRVACRYLDIMNVNQIGFDKMFFKASFALIKSNMNGW